VSLTLSPQMRLVALLGALAAVVLGAAMFFLTRSGGGEVSAVSQAELTQALTPLATGAKPTAAAPKPVAKPKTAAKAKPKRTPPPAVTKDGIPWAIAQALRRDRVVVVSLFAGGAEVDELTLAEARAGAYSAGAGFVALDVLAKRNAEPLATFLGGVAEPPITLVYQRPTALFLKFDGFVDRDTVAQAAQNAGAVAAQRG
jgi:hypothetical protein